MKNIVKKRGIFTKKENNNIQILLGKMESKGTHMSKFLDFCKRIFLIGIIIYAVITFINQQKILNTYAANEEELDEQIAEATEYQEELNETKENVNSEEYIEEMAREKLDMYKSNERVYISSE